MPKTAQPRLARNLDKIRQSERMHVRAVINRHHLVAAPPQVTGRKIPMKNAALAHVGEHRDHAGAATAVIRRGFFPGQCQDGIGAVAPPFQQRIKAAVAPGFSGKRRQKIGALF